LVAHLKTLQAQAPEKFGSDITSALALAAACREGARANVEINLDFITAEDFPGKVRERLAVS
jgi:formiminotetrahydrofolate cyclodeaminase